MNNTNTKEACIKLLLQKGKPLKNHKRIAMIHNGKIYMGYYSKGFLFTGTLDEALTFLLEATPNEVEPSKRKRNFTI